MAEVHAQPAQAAHPDFLESPVVIGIAIVVNGNRGQLSQVRARNGDPVGLALLHSTRIEEGIDVAAVHGDGCASATAVEGERQIGVRSGILVIGGDDLQPVGFELRMERIVVPGGQTNFWMTVFHDVRQFGLAAVGNNDAVHACIDE